MSASGRQGLTARIRQIRSAYPTVTGAPTAASPATEAEVPGDELQSLRRRLAELEQLVQGLQDAVFRESQRHERRITELEARTEPSVLAVALSKNARERGL
jgi:hypothetical protein